MDSFCTRCGSPLKAGAAFCIGCGAPVSQTPAAGPAHTPAQPPAAGSSSPLLKIVLIGVGVLFIIGAMALAGMIYAGYRVKKSVERYARKNGVELSDFTSSAARGRRLDPCSLLTKEEAGQIFGLTVVRSDRSGPVCSYFAQPATAEQRQAEARRALEGTQAKGERPSDPREAIRQSGVEDLVKNMVGSVNNGSAPYFTITVHEDGKTQMAAVKLAMGAMGAGAVSESLKGIADDAIMGPMDSMLWFLKNGTGVEIDLRQVPKGRERGIAMAQRMVPRM